MKLILFSGFLGAGKTSAIISMSRFFQKEYVHEQSGVQLVVIENEIGKTDYDASLLADSRLSVINMSSGCICCSLNTELVRELFRVQTEYAPEYVVFEPTGLAYPIRILDVIYAANIAVQSTKIVTVVDAKRFGKIINTTPDLFTGQIKSADIILLTKTDQVSPEEADQVEMALKQESGTARLFRFDGLQGQPDDVWREVFCDTASS